MAEEACTYHSATLETWTAQVGSDSAFAGSASAARAGGDAAAAATVAAAAARATPLARWAAGGEGFRGSRRDEGGGEGASAATSRRDAMKWEELRFALCLAFTELVIASVQLDASVSVTVL